MLIFTLNCPFIKLPSYPAAPKKLQSIHNIDILNNVYSEDETMSVADSTRAKETSTFHEYLQFSLHHPSHLTTFLHSGKELCRISNVDTQLFTNALMAKFNMKGKQGKRSLKKSKFYRAIKDGIMNGDEAATEDIIRIHDAEHLKHAAQRSGGGGHKAITKD
ncbi:hypothetical protein ILYODFUR_034784 [Ilyodon furcidens]|uniref:Uncharacterized protein n=1 Tax=Ilyodon furcidens TaxID=33524 RepID=A0ABV0UM02_9TELE